MRRATMRDYGYSYEIYEPESAEGDPGRRIDYEDHFLTRRDAVAAMREVMMREDVPAGSTAFVCRRYDDGEMTNDVDYVKEVSTTVRRVKEGAA
jgi:hypothetical protein